MGRAKVTKKQWLEVGLACFAKSGIAGLRVEQMAKTLGSPKSGFYWYFGTRERFVGELVAYWTERDTDSFIKVADKEESPLDRFIALLRVIARGKLHVEFAYHLRRTALKDAKLKKQLHDVELRRMNYVARIFRELGMKERESKQKANFLYSYSLGWMERYGSQRPSEKDIEEQIKLIIKYLQIGPA